MSFHPLMMYDAARFQKSERKLPDGSQIVLEADGDRSVLAIRAGRWTAHTSGMAEGHVQGNVVILPKAHADDFLRFCQRNPKPCPLIAVSETGDPSLPELGRDIDIRTDVPRYRVWRNGELVSEPIDIRDLWNEKLVAFLIGCSFSFEEALMVMPTYARAKVNLDRVVSDIFAREESEAYETASAAETPAVE